MPADARQLVDPASFLRRGTILVIFIILSRCAAADPPSAAEEQREQQRAQLLEQMRLLARATNVRYQASGHQPAPTHRPKLVDSPVFRYDDQPRFFLDATMWVWTDANRPVAFEKIEVMSQDRPRWGYCLTSVSDRLLSVTWADGREYRSSAAGIDFRPLPDAPAAPARSAARKLGARKLARDFSARILTDDRANTSEEMRLLSTPIFEYDDPQTNSFLGAVFGLATSGTNPDVLFLLEPRDAGGESVWHYAVGRMTTGGVTLKYREAKVWEAEFCQPVPTAFPTWTFFTTLRDEPKTSETEE